MRAPAWLEKLSRSLCVHTIRFFVFHCDIAAVYRAVCGRLPSCIEKQWVAIANVAHKSDDAASHVSLRPKGILGIKKAQRPVSTRLCFLGFLLREQKTLRVPHQQNLLIHNFGMGKFGMDDEDRDGSKAHSKTACAKTGSPWAYSRIMPWARAT